MATLHFESWASASPPAAPSGWTFSSPIETAAAGGSNPPAMDGSSSNLIGLNTTSSTREAATWGTADGVGGNVQVQGTAYFQGASFSIGNISVFGRSNASTTIYASSTFYELQLSLTSGELLLNSVVSGSKSGLQFVSVSLNFDYWYQFTLTCNGTTLQGSLQRLTDGYWLNSSGAWQSAMSTALSVSDSSISGSGYSGWMADESSIHTGVWGQDWTLSSLTPSIAPPRPVVGQVPWGFFPAYQF